MEVYNAVSWAENLGTEEQLAFGIYIDVLWRRYVTFVSLYTQHLTPQSDCAIAHNCHQVRVLYELSHNLPYYTRDQMNSMQKVVVNQCALTRWAKKGCQFLLLRSILFERASKNKVWHIYHPDSPSISGTDSPQSHISAPGVR